MRIGIDFDNTIVSYDRIFHSEALSQGLIKLTCPATKLAVRDCIRHKHGELAWQKLQGRVYGPCMPEAEIMPGFKEFLFAAAEHGADIFVVSHKTKYSPHDDTQTNLRQASLDWLQTHGLLDNKNGLRSNGIFFESTREDKVVRINSLGCTHFIDDLEEVLLHRDLDTTISRFHFLPVDLAKNTEKVTVCRSWEEITRFVFQA